MRTRKRRVGRGLAVARSRPLTTIHVCLKMGEVCIFCCESRVALLVEFSHCHMVTDLSFGAYFHAVSKLSLVV